MEEKELRKELVYAMRRLEDLGLNYGRAGNASARLGRGLYLITPSGAYKANLNEEDILIIDESMKVIKGSGKPSVEVAMHLKIYESFPKVNAVIHCHPIYLTAASLLPEEEIPLLTEEAILLIGSNSLRISSFAPSGSLELAEEALKALRGSKVAVLRNHGALAVGESVEEALEAMILAERQAQIYLIAYSSLQSKKGLSMLPKELVKELLDKVSSRRIT